MDKSSVEIINASDIKHELHNSDSVWNNDVRFNHDGKILNQDKQDIESLETCLTTERNTGSKTGSIDELQKRGFRKCLSKFSKDKTYRQNWIYTVLVYSAFLSLGWLKGQVGPSFLDLLEISGTDLEAGSWIVTAYYIGYICGSIVGGIVYKFINPVLLFSIALFLLTVVHALIPWCYLFELMLISHVWKGIGAGITDTHGIAEIFKVWKIKGHKFMIGTNFIFSIGSVLSPLITAPFLMDISEKDDTITPTTNNSANYTTNVYGKSGVYNMTVPTTFNINSSNHDLKEQTSNVYIAYLITASMCMANTLSFVILFVFQRRKAASNSDEKLKLVNNVRQLPVPVQVYVFILTGMVLLTFSAIDEAFSAYLTTFCVDYLEWTKKNGAFLTSVVFICIALSRLLSVFVAGFINPVVVVGITSCILFVDFIGFTLVSIYKIEIGIWIFAALFGFAKSITFALVISWTNEYFFPVTGIVSAYYMVVAMLGGAVNPLILGYLMEHVAKIAFSYLFLIESAVLLTVVCASAGFTKYVTKKYGPTFITTETIDVNESKDTFLNPVSDEKGL